MKKLRFAIVGCGMIGSVHSSVVNEIEDAELYAVWDLDEKKARETADKYGARVFSTFEELLCSDEVDAVTICTPSLCHKEQAIAALAHGKHVVLEKPMALSASDAEEICEAAKRYDRRLTVIFQARFSEDVRRVKQLIDEGAFGRLTFCDLYMKLYRNEAYYGDSPWRGTWKYDGGGALMNQGIHGIDLLHYLVGEARLLAGRAKTNYHDIEVEDTASALVEFDGGALGVIEASTCTAPGFRRHVEINGTRGYVIISDMTIERLYIDGEMLVSNDIDPHPNTAASPALVSNDYHKGQIENFIRAVLYGERLEVTPEDGCYAVKFIESIYKSSEEFNK